MTNSPNSTDVVFDDLLTCDPIKKAIADLGYKSPTPIQAGAIPLLLEGCDLIGQAQTGTGKTAAFALPTLSRIDLKSSAVQVLVLTPTRELAIQVAEEFARYGKYLRGLGVLPIYGGKEIGHQLRGLKKGAQVIIGTPGRVMDHLRRGTLVLDGLKTLVLDEADEMLRMGFIEDVEWILEKTPSARQIALFSATMPKQVRQMAKRYLNEPQQLVFETRLTAAAEIRQRFMVVPGYQKADALIRILEMEQIDGVMVFVKTKRATMEVAEKLSARGVAACALNGDLSQSSREHTVARLKKGEINVIVATDVAARGLDVDRISHVFNFDAPGDVEAYVHRIGRTGRAGRHGEAILFLNPQERRILTNIERATGQPIVKMPMPSVEAINAHRMERFKDKITRTIAERDTSFFKELLQSYKDEHDANYADVAAAVAYLLQGDVPMMMSAPNPKKRAPRRSELKPPVFSSDRQSDGDSSAPMDRYRVDVGAQHGVQVSNIVGAIANEAGIDSRYIGKVTISDDHSTVDLPTGMPRKVRRLLKRVWVCNTQLNLARLESPRQDSGAAPGGRNQKLKPRPTSRNKAKRAKKRAA